MNEKIRQLAEQAIDSVVFSKIETIPQMEQFAEKFAELIVKECVGIVDNKIEVSRYVHEAELLRECSTTIKLHFGVEE